MRVNRTFTVTTSPINVFTGTTVAPSASSEPVYASRIEIQMVAGGSGMGYVMSGIRPIGRTPSNSNDDDVSEQLAKATASAPGGSYEDAAQGSGEDPIDIRTVWVDGANAGDKIKVSYDLKV